MAAKASQHVPSMASSKVPVFHPSIGRSGDEPCKSENAYLEFKLVKSPPKPKRLLTWWAIRVALVLLVVLLILALTLGLVFGIRSARQQSGSSARASIVKLNVNQAQMATPSPLPQPFSNRCLKHCYDHTYVACPCDDAVCNCPRDRVSVSDDSSQASSWWDNWSWRSPSISQTTCIALCSPDFTPKQIDCENLLNACSDDDDTDED